MLNVNFVPDEYVDNKQSYRTNWMYSLLFLIVILSLTACSGAIKFRRQMLVTREKELDAMMTAKQEKIKQFEELQVKRNAMWDKALRTTELLEPVPRSLIIACLTNSLPKGVSFVEVKIVQMISKEKPGAQQLNDYESAREKAANTGKVLTMEQLLETEIDIAGIADNNDVQVAAFIEQLSVSPLLDSVALIESIEHSTKEGCYREFKLKTKLKKGYHPSIDDLKEIAMAGGSQNANVGVSAGQEN